jgi:GNAT superfamily N-acetyltransferase
MQLMVFLNRMVSYLMDGRLDLCLLSITRKLPKQLAVFNMAVMVRTQKINITDELNNSIAVKQADPDDINHVISITGWSEEYTIGLQNSKVIFFLASLPEAKPSGFLALCSGCCYVRGMGFEYYFDTDETYWFAILVLPENRRKGLYLKMCEAVDRYIESNHIRQHYALIEITNERSLALHYKMGFRDFLKITFVKIGPLKISLTKEVETGKKTCRIFIKEPEVTII